MAITWSTVTLFNDNNYWNNDYPHRAIITVAGRTYAFRKNHGRYIISDDGGATWSFDDYGFNYFDGGSPELSGGDNFAPFRSMGRSCVSVSPDASTIALIGSSNGSVFPTAAQGVIALNVGTGVWTSFDLPNTYGYGAIAAASASVWLVVGKNSSDEVVIGRTIDSGANWNFSVLANGYTVENTAFGAYSESGLQLFTFPNPAGASGPFAHDYVYTTDNGASWSYGDFVTGGIKSSARMHVTKVGSTYVAIGFNGAGNAVYCFTTTNPAAGTWTANTLTGGLVYPTSTEVVSDVLYTYDAINNLLVESSDLGATWVAVTTPPSGMYISDEADVPMGASATRLIIGYAGNYEAALGLLPPPAVPDRTQLFTNNAKTTLATQVEIGDLTITLASGAGSKFSSPTGGDYQLVTLANADETLVEIVKVTGRSGDVLTVERAQEDTSALQWPTATTKVYAAVTRDTMYRAMTLPGPPEVVPITLSGNYPTNEYALTAADAGKILNITFNNLDANYTPYVYLSAAEDALIPEGTEIRINVVQQFQYATYTSMSSGFTPNWMQSFFEIYADNDVFLCREIDTLLNATNTEFNPITTYYQDFSGNCSVLIRKLGSGLWFVDSPDRMDYGLIPTTLTSSGIRNTISSSTVVQLTNLQDTRGRNNRVHWASPTSVAFNYPDGANMPIYPGFTIHFLQPDAVTQWVLVPGISVNFIYDDTTYALKTRTKGSRITAMLLSTAGNQYTWLIEGDMELL